VPFESLSRAVPAARIRHCQKQAKRNENGAVDVIRTRTDLVNDSSFSFSPSLRWRLEGCFLFLAASAFLTLVRMLMDSLENCCYTGCSAGWDK
jgi:hypothetical protein